MNVAATGDGVRSHVELTTQTRILTEVTLQEVCLDAHLLHILHRVAQADVCSCSKLPQLNRNNVPSLVIVVCAGTQLLT